MMELLNEFLSGSVAWGVLLTLAAFALGALVNRVTGKAFFNPLLLGAIFVIVFLSVKCLVWSLALFCEAAWKEMLWHGLRLLW